VKAMLASEEVAARMKKEVSLADLEDDDCRAVAARIFALLDEGITKEVGARLHFDEDRLNRLVASWLVDYANSPEEGVVLQEAKDCLARIHRRRIDRESQLLQEKISAAEKAGERDVLTKLLKIKQGLRLPAK
jgi:hypothetical protein